MRIKLVQAANDSNVNEQCEYLESRGYTIIDIIFNKQDYKNFTYYAIIKYN